MRLNNRWLLQELVPQEVYEEYGDKSIRFLDRRLPTLLLQISFLTGSRIIVNTWHNERNGFQERGFRTPESTVGSPLSQHKQGRAADITSLDIDIKESYEIILKNYNYLRDFGLTRIKLDASKNYIHLDMAWTGSDKLIIL